MKKVMFSVIRLCFQQSLWVESVVIPGQGEKGIYS